MTEVNEIYFLNTFYSPMTTNESLVNGGTVGSTASVVITAVVEVEETLGVVRFEVEVASVETATSVDARNTVVVSIAVAVTTGGPVEVIAVNPVVVSGRFVCGELVSTVTCTISVVSVKPAVVSASEAVACVDKVTDSVKKVVLN